MRISRSQRACLGDRRAIRSDGNEGLAQRVLHVFLGVMEVDGGDRAAVFFEQLEEHVDPRLADGLYDFVHPLAFELLVLWIREGNQQHAIPAAGRGVVVVPVRAGNAVIYFTLQTLAQQRILEPRDQRLRAALVSPRRDDARQVVLSGAIWV